MTADEPDRGQGFLRPPAMPRRVRVRQPRPVSRRLAVVSLLVAAVVAVLLPGQVPTWWAVPATALGGGLALLLLTSSFPARPSWSAACLPMVLAAALALRPGAWVGPTIGLTYVLHSLAIGRPRSRLFADVTRTTSAATVASSIAAVLVDAGAPKASAAAAAVLVLWGISHLLAGMEAAATTGRPLRGLLRSRAREGLISALAAAALGVGIGVELGDGWAGIPAIGIPAGLVWVTGREDGRRAAEARAIVELARLRHGGPDASSVDSDVAARAFVTAVARLVGGADVELLVVAAEGPVRYHGDEAGHVVRERVAPQAFDDPLVVRALAGSGVVVIVGPGDRPTAAIALRSVGEGDTGACILTRPAGAAPFNRGERLILAAVKEQAATWLRPTETSGPRQRFTPSRPESDGPMIAVREAALRLARAAGEPTGQEDSSLARVVDELHMVERSVAGLLGGVKVTEGKPADNPDREWTTSGTFVSGR